MYYINRLKQLGLSGMRMVCKREYAKRLFAKKYAGLAREKKAAATWERIMQETGAPAFAPFLATVIQNEALDRLIATPEFNQFLPPLFHSQAQYEKMAHDICAGEYNFLGATLATKKEKLYLPWHEDTKSSQETTFQPYAHLFFREIAHTATGKAAAYQSIHQEEYTADIKIPWERSRLQHLFILGWAATHSASHEDDTIDSDKSQNVKIYITTIINHLTNWLDHNPFLLGVNWLCPMEVAIRAINILWAFDRIKRSPLVDEALSKRIICSLYDHLLFLEAHWEVSDKPNNHYLADLIGALYLALFFKNLPSMPAKITLFQELLDAQFAHQILPDGTVYEGSTAYHRLVTEMHLHYSWLSNVYKLKRAPEHSAREKKMLTFLADCTQTGEHFLMIGDDDSGKILAGIYLNPSSVTEEKNIINTYPDFGLTIIKTENWHSSLRHATYASHQPTGHFHDDELSITVNYNNIPVLIDPGSYCYTAAPILRNKFRSALFHNSMTIIPAYDLFEEPPRDLFQLDKEAQHKKSRFQQNTHPGYSVTSFQRTHKPITYEKERTLTVHEKSITWTDRITIIEKKSLDSWNTSWTLLFHPAISVQQKRVREWLLFYQQKAFMRLTTTQSFRVTEGFYAPSYGIKVPCVRLWAKATCMSQEQQASLELLTNAQ